MGHIQAVGLKTRRVKTGKGWRVRAVKQGSWPSWSTFGRVSGAGRGVRTYFSREKAGLPVGAVLMGGRWPQEVAVDIC